MCRAPASAKAATNEFSFSIFASFRAMNESIRLFWCEKVARCTWSNQNCHKEYIHQFWISFTFSCSYAAVRSVARILKLELHQRLSADNSAWSSQTTPNLVKLVLPVLQCLVPASLYRSANDEPFVIALFWACSLSVSISEMFWAAAVHALCIWYSVRFEILPCLLVVTVLPVRPTIHWSIFGRVLRWCDPFSSQPSSSVAAV